MTKLLVLTIFFFLSCQSNELEGIWVGQYNQLDLNGERTFTPLRTIIRFEENKFYNNIIGKEGIDSFEFVRRKNAIIPREKSAVGFKILSVTQDSLTMTIPQMENYTLVYKKYYGGQGIELNLTEQSYSSIETGDQYKFGRYSKLFKNSENGGTWNIISIMSTKFLELNEPQGTRFLLVDSIQKGKIYLTEYSIKIQKLTLVKD